MDHLLRGIYENGIALAEDEARQTLSNGNASTIARIQANAVLVALDERRNLLRDHDQLALFIKRLLAEHQLAGIEDGRVKGLLERTGDYFESVGRPKPWESIIDPDAEIPF